MADAVPGSRVARLHTPLCDLLGITHPIVLGGMASGTAAELVAAVSNAGGLGIRPPTFPPFSKQVFWRRQDDSAAVVLCTAEHLFRAARGG